MRLYLTFIFLSTVAILRSQPLCDFDSLLFEEITPKWTHYSIDSNYIDTLVAFGRDSFEYHTGYDVLVGDLGSFIHEGYIYSSNSYWAGFGVSGSFIEKIDLDTGALIWKVHGDKPRLGRFEEITSINIENDRLVLRGYKRIDRKNIFFQREYDLESGELVNNIDPPITNSSQNIYNDYGIEMFLSDENTIIHFDPISSTLRGDTLEQYIIRNEYSLSSELLTGPDTLYHGFYNNTVGHSGAEYYYKRLSRTPSGDFVFIEYFSPIENPENNMQGRFILFDSSMQIKTTYDFTEDLGGCSRADILHIDEEKFIVRLCHSVWPRYIGCQASYVTLDYNFNVLNVVKSEYQDQELYQDLDYIDDEGNLYLWEYYPGYENQCVNTLFKSDDSNLFSPLFDLTMGLYPNYNFAPRKMFILDNGDLLMRFVHGCAPEGESAIFEGAYSWQYFSAEDIPALSSTISFHESSKHAITVYPNPATTQVTIEANSRIDNVVISDILGKKVKSKGMHNSTINLDDIPPGTYFMSLFNNNELISTEIIIKI